MVAWYENLVLGSGCQKENGGGTEQIVNIGGKKHFGKLTGQFIFSGEKHTMNFRR